MYTAPPSGTNRLHKLIFPAIVQSCSSLQASLKSRCIVGDSMTVTMNSGSAYQDEHHRVKWPTTRQSLVDS